MLTYKILSCLTAALLVGACSDLGPSFVVGGDQDRARALAPVADPFQQALVDGYTKNADDEYYQGNYRTADLYYLKAIATANDKNTVMEQPNSWTVATGDRARGLHGADKQSAETMRDNLAPWIAANRQSNPHAAAAQQLKYDCWIEQMSEQQYNQAAICGPTLQTAAAPAPAAAPPPAPTASLCMQDPSGYNESGTLCRVSVVRFAFDRYGLLQPGQNSVGGQTAADQDAALDQILSQVKTIKPARIDVMGRTDSSGTNDYNYGLSDCRARSVVAALRARGLPASVETRIIPMGQTDLILPTGNGVREAQNRVVLVAYQTDRNAALAARPEMAPKRDAFGCGTSRHPFPPLN
ncbi:OmpA family protein [Pelagibius sp. CAU 1746]|uniref:OmpA family protein n=1 Tax=Pelagibius sp. CAU 1746 TaxID=3140370 RepID=UPI00325B5B40